MGRTLIITRRPAVERGKVQTYGHWSVYKKNPWGGRRYYVETLETILHIIATWEYDGVIKIRFRAS